MVTLPREREHELPLLIRATEALLLAAYDEQAVLTVALKLLQDHFGHGNAYLMLYDRAAGDLALAEASGQGADLPEVRGFRTKLGVGLTGIAGETRKVVNVGDVTKDPRYLDVVPGCVSEICIPLVVRGELFGVLAIESTERDAFGQRDEELLLAFARVLALALLHARANAEARRLAVTDPLTGLYNVRYLTERLEEEIARAKRYRRELSLLMVDSDALKRVNDELGHSAGNELLVSLARTLRESVRATDLVARFGGDEFVVLQPETGLAAALATAERIRSAAYAAPDVAGGERSVSVGVATYPVTAQDADELFSEADAALYRAKRAGKNRVVAAGS